MSDVNDDLNDHVVQCAARRLRLVGTDTKVIGARAALHADLTTAKNDPNGCPCAKCRDHALTAAEADAALDHVTDADALRFADGKVVVTSCGGCEGCDAWVPTFTEPVVDPSV